MDIGMGSSLPMEKFDKSNYAFWLYKMHQYLLRHDYWSYVEGANEVPPEPIQRDFPAWEQATSRLLYYFASCVSDLILGYIRDAKRPKEASGNLKKISPPSTMARKLQLKQELNKI